MSSRKNRYNPAAINAAIASSSRAGRKISKGEAALIHRVLQDRTPAVKHDAFQTMLDVLRECEAVLPTLIDDGDDARDQSGRKLLGLVQFAIATAKTAARAESAAPERTTP
jgi:hypothetical protein